MKPSACNTHLSFEEKVAQARSREVPVVNVRVRVRQALMSRLEKRSEQSIEDVLALWFSGFKGGLVGGLLLLMLLLTGAFAANQLMDWKALQQEQDVVEAFLSRGDWTELL